MDDDEFGEAIEEFDVPGEQHIEAPTDTELTAIAQCLVHAAELAKQCAGSSLDGSLEDLKRIQAVLDSNTVEPEAAYSLEALGAAFGVVFINHNTGFDWWMVDDARGRTPAIQYEESRILIFPMDMIVKRVEAGEKVNVVRLYKQLCAGTEKIVEDVCGT